MHEGYVIEDLRRRGIDTIYCMTDGCAAQYQNKYHLGNVAGMKDKWGMNFIQIFWDPHCGKGPHDSAGRLLKVWIKNLRTKGKEGAFPAQDSLDAFKRIHKVTPKRAETYKKLREDKDWEKLLKAKGRFGHDEYQICMSTHDKQEHSEVEAWALAEGGQELKDKILYVDRSERVIATPVDKLKGTRFYTGLPNSSLTKQKHFCYCSGCASSKKCLHNDVSGANDREEMTIDKVLGGVKYTVNFMEEFEKKKAKKRFKKETQQYELTKVIKNKSRALVEAWIDKNPDGIGGKLYVMNDKNKMVEIQQKMPVVFTGRQGLYTADRKWDIGVVKGTVKDDDDFVVVTRLQIQSEEYPPGGLKEKEFKVKKSDIQLSVAEKPNSTVVQVTISEGVLAKLNYDMCNMDN